MISSMFCTFVSYKELSTKLYDKTPKNNKNKSVFHPDMELSSSLV